MCPQGRSELNSGGILPESVTSCDIFEDRLTDIPSKTIAFTRHSQSKPLNSRKFLQRFSVQPLNNALAPSFSLLSIHDRPADIRPGYRQYRPDISTKVGGVARQNEPTEHHRSVERLNTTQFPVVISFPSGSDLQADLQHSAYTDVVDSVEPADSDFLRHGKSTWSLDRSSSRSERRERTLMP